MAHSTKNFIIYKASAGSGKTYTLVKEYLKLVLADPSKFRHILAVTFTNKAAYEMKSRIMSSLKILSSLGEDTVPEEDKESVRKKNGALISELCENSGLDEKGLAYRSGIILHSILHNYSDFAISTIDSFVQKIIRTFAYDLKISQNFEVELDADRVLSEAVDVLISYAGSEPQITRMLIKFIEQKMDDGQNWDISLDLKTFSKQLLKEDTQKFILLFKDIQLADFSKVISGLTSRRLAAENSARKLAGVVIKLIKDNDINPKSFYQGLKGIPGFFMKVSENGLMGASPNSSCDKAIQEDLWYSKTQPENEKNKIDAVKEQIAKAYQAIVCMIREFRDLTVIIKSLYPLSLLSQIEKETEAVKSDGNLIFISDFYRKIHEQLLGEPVPFIYQRAGEKFAHYFIDEFQDTSVLQFQNMLPLIENALASGNKNLIVGDGKQAIYRWRDGEVMQFASLPAIYKKPDLPHFSEIENALSRNIIYYYEYSGNKPDVNYRSKAEIINFNNNLFSFLADEVLPDEKRSIYLDNRQKPRPGNDGGYVRIKFFEAGPDFADRQFAEILEIINGLSSSNTSLKDIAIICRINKQAANIASFLLQMGIDVVSSESLLLNSSPKVNFIVSVLRYVDNPSDELAAAFVINFLQQNYPAALDLNTLIAKYQSAKSTSKSKYPLNKIFTIFQKDIDCVKMSGTPLFDLVESLVRTFAFNDHPDPFIIYFLDAINEFVSTKTPCLPDFIQWWDEKGATRSIVVPDQLDAVKIMTIHKAKGLEFPVLIYPFADEMPGSKGASAWVVNSLDYCPEIPAFPIAISAKGLEGTSFSGYYEEEQSLARLDMMNICYVALTRSEEQLYVLTKKYKENGHSFGSLLKKYLMHLELWSDEKDLYEFGNIAPVISKKNQAGKGLTVVPENILSSDWTGRMLIRHDSTVLWTDDETATTRGWGNIIHKILSEIKQAGDVNGVTTSMLLEGIISQADAEKITEYIELLMATPHFKSFFEPGLSVLTEQEILTPGNKVYRPDRILLEEHKNVVVDFKTGTQKDEHKTQVENYAALLTEINNKPTEKYLIYLHEKPLIIKVE